ncbi:MAG: hypothetical protein R3B09_00620 [Nannocystaceae bacterium]
MRSTGMSFGTCLGGHVPWFIFVALALACARTPAIPSAAATDDPPALASRSTSPRAPGPAASPAPSPLASEAAAVVEVAESLAAVYSERAGACPELAAALEEFAGARGAPLREAKPAVLAHIDGDEGLRARLRAAMEAVMTGGIACEGDPAYLAIEARARGG